MRVSAAEPEIILHFTLFEGKNANAEVAGRALLAWIDLFRESVRQINPDEKIIVELINIERSSLRINQVIRILEDQIASIVRGGKKYPHLSHIFYGLVAYIAIQGMDFTIERFLKPEQIVRLSDEDRAILRSIPNSASFREKSQHFYRIIEQDPAIASVGIAPSRADAPILPIPRSEFSQRGGLLLSPTEEWERRLFSSEEDVVLIKPDLRSSPRSWLFQRRDGTQLSAIMNDPAVLAQLAGDGIETRMREGIPMRIILEWQERNTEEGWRYIERTRSVVKVISPVIGSASPPTNPP